MIWRSKIRTVISGMALVLLCACTVPAAKPIYRDTSVPMGVTSRFDAETLSDRWSVRAWMPGDQNLRAVQFLTLKNFPTMIATFEEGELVRTLVYRGEKGEKGRFTFWATDRSDVRDIVFLWVDEGGRTAAVGDAAGTYAWVLDRRPTGGADRIAAAKEVLDFNGFDVSQLLTVSK